MGRHMPGNDAAHKLRTHQAGQYGNDDNAELEKDIAPSEAFQKLFKENDKVIGRIGNGVSEVFRTHRQIRPMHSSIGRFCCCG